jgi:flagellar biosynthesis protein FliR
MSEVQILFFALILLRMLGFVISAAVFNHPSLNISLRILFSLVLVMCIYPSIQIPAALSSGFGDQLVLFALRETLVGIVIGFLTRFFFFILSMAGDLVSMSLGLSSAQLYNPMTQSNSGLFEQFYITLGAVFFLLFNGHHILITSLVNSYTHLPAGQIGFSSSALAEVAASAGLMIGLALKIAAPIIVSVFLANIVMGVLGRAIPQLNVLVTSFPVVILIGFIMIIMCMPLLVHEMGLLVDISASQLMKTVKAL